MKTIPKYQEIIIYLTNKIDSKIYPAGSKLPTEEALAKQFSTSRPTVVKAMDRLRDANLVYRVQGKGSFVCQSSQPTQNTQSNVISLVLPFAQYRNAARIDEMNILKGVATVLEKNGYYLMVHYCQDNDDDFIKTIRDVRNSPSIATIAYVARGLIDCSEIYDLFMGDYPLILIDKTIVGSNYPCVQSDNIAGANTIVDHLVDFGYDHIYFISDCEFSSNESIRERYVGFCQGVQKHKKSAVFGHFMMDRQDDDQTQLDNVLKTLVQDYKDGARVGLFCTGDYFALRVYNTLLSMGVDVPQKFGIVGFDGLKLKTKDNRTLTTVEQNFYKIGKVSSESVIKLLSDLPISLEDTKIPVSLVQGNTTSPY